MDGPLELTILIKKTYEKCPLIVDEFYFYISSYSLPLELFWFGLVHHLSINMKNEYSLFGES